MLDACVCAHNALVFNIPADILLLDMAGTARTVTRVRIKTEDMIVPQNVRPKLPECPLLPACNVDHKSMLLNRTSNQTCFLLTGGRS